VFFSAHDGNVEKAFGIDVDFAVGIADGFETFREVWLAFCEVVFVGGGECGDGCES